MKDSNDFPFHPQCPVHSQKSPDSQRNKESTHVKVGNEPAELIQDNPEVDVREENDHKEYAECKTQCKRTEQPQNIYLNVLKLKTVSAMILKCNWIGFTGDRK